MPPALVNRCSITVPFDTYEGVDTELIPEEEEVDALGTTGCINAKNRLATNATISNNAVKLDEIGILINK